MLPPVAAALVLHALAASVKVACVGDSITAGYLASNASFAYPGRLQSLLDHKFGAGAYLVTNFGAGGATVQKHADSPYWNRTQFTAWASGRYDVVVAMLGTNDAKDAGHGGAPNWPPACSLPRPSAASCPVVADYLSLLALAQTKGVGGAAPLLAIMRPPPLWRDAAYGMNESVLNDVMPPLVTHVGALAALPESAVLDVYGALGGSAAWRATYPPCGCVRPPPPPQQQQQLQQQQGGQREPAWPAARSAGAPNCTADGNYCLARGFLQAGNDLEHANLTFAQATAACTARGPDCAGITFKQNQSRPAAAVPMYLKHCAGGATPAEGWWSWTKNASAVPPPSQPPACALFCQNGQSCDACHPDDDGYLRIAEIVMEWIVAHAHAKIRDRTER